MVKRMGVMYLNPDMEGVRQVALRNFKNIYQDIVEDLKEPHSREELIEKYKELANNV